MELPASPTALAAETSATSEPNIWPTAEWERPLSPSGSVRRLRPRANYVMLDATQLAQAAIAEEQHAPALEAPRVFLTGIDMQGAMPQRPATTPDHLQQHELLADSLQGLEAGPSTEQLHALSAPATPTLQQTHGGPSIGGEPSKQFTVQYMGIANGELGILTKRESIASRPSTAPTGEVLGTSHDARLPSSVDIKSLADNTRGDIYEPPPAFGAFYVLRRLPGQGSARRKSPVQESLARLVQEQKAADAKAIRTAARRASSAAFATPAVVACSKDFPITSRPRRLSAGGFAGWKMLPGPKLTAGGFPGQKLSLLRPDMVVRPVVPPRAQSAPGGTRQQAALLRRQAEGSPGEAGSDGGGRQLGVKSPWRKAERPSSSMAPIAEGRARQGAHAAAGAPGQGLHAARPRTSPLASPSAGGERGHHAIHGPHPKPQQRPLSGTLFSFLPPEGSLPRVGASGSSLSHPNLKTEGSDRPKTAPSGAETGPQPSSSRAEGAASPQHSPHRGPHHHHHHSPATTTTTAAETATATAAAAAAELPQHRVVSGPVDAISPLPADHQLPGLSLPTHITTHTATHASAHTTTHTTAYAAVHPSSSSHPKPHAFTQVHSRGSSSHVVAPSSRYSLGAKLAAKAKDSGWVLQGTSARVGAGPGTKPRLHSARSEVGPWQTSTQDSSIDLGLGIH